MEKNHVDRKNMPVKHVMLDVQYDIVFIHQGQQVSLSAGINPLTNDWMYWWSTNNSMHVGTCAEILTMVRNIKKNSEDVILNTFPD